MTRDILEARYRPRIDETGDGTAVTLDAPRLTVFRRAGERWQVAAYANFAATA